MDEWSNIANLRYGTERQQAAYRALLDSDLFMVLADYSPVLAGTVPLNIDLPTSDLDILTHAPDLNHFEQDASFYYAHMPDFETRHKNIQDVPTFICRFLQGAFSIELFAQPVPVEQQAAFRHLVVQSRLLRLASDDARRAIRGLKREGLNTEAAFCRYFLIPGEPRAALLALYDAPITELEELVIAAAHRRDPYAIPE